MIGTMKSLISRYVVTVPLAFALTLETAAQETPSRQVPWPAVISNSAWKEKRHSGYLSSVLDLLDREREAMASEEIKDVYRDVAATQLAFVGAHWRATKLGDEAYGKLTANPHAPAGEPFKNYSPAPAVQAIIKAAKDRQLVMVNEEHRSSEQRAFSNQLLSPLRKHGFRYLALETVSEDAALLNARGYPVLSTGFYTRDPAFGDLVRRALELGYTIVPYEPSFEQLRSKTEDRSPLDRVNRRERFQADNIHKRTFSKDPSAKVLVIGGRGHIAESAGQSWKPMGGILKGLSGIDPLTIHLYEMVEHSDVQYEHWAFTVADKRGWTRKGPVLLVDDQGEFWTATPGVFDAHVLHPRTTSTGGRPQWMAMGGLRKPVVVDVPRFERPVLLQAKLSGELEQAVPIDQVILWPRKPTLSLYLRPGSYVIRIIDRNGTELFQEARVVAAW